MRMFIAVAVIACVSTLIWQRYNSDFETEMADAGYISVTLGDRTVWVQRPRVPFR